MLLELSKLKGLPLGIMDEGRRGGEILRALFDPEQVKIIGFLIKTENFWGQNKIVALSDVIAIDGSGAVVNSSDDILDIRDIVRVERILKDKIKLVGLRAYDKKNNFLGYVYDGVADSQTGDLVRFYVKFLFRKYIFGRSQVVKADDKKIVFDTDSKIINKEAEILPDAAEAF